MASKSSELPPMLTEVPDILAQENGFVFDSFTSETAFELGCLLKSRIPTLVPHGPPAAVQITLGTGGGNILFHAVTKPGNGSGASVAPDNDAWIARKRETVLKWGLSSYALHHKFTKMASQESIHAFKIRYGEENIGKYCLFGGGFPVRVKGVEGVVAVIIVSGLKHHEDHLVIVKVLQEWFAKQQ